MQLSHLFVFCLEAGKVPKRWSDSVMFLLAKVKEPPITCDVVRPLSILPMFWRIFESLLLPVLVKLPAKLREDFQVEKQNRGGSYELLDYLLNLGKWNLAHEIISSGMPC